LNLQENDYFCTQIDKNLRRKSIYIQLFILLTVLVSCGGNQKDGPVVTPWGSVLDSVNVSDNFDLTQIQRNGELIMVTMSGPETYYDYHGRSLGTQYLLCERFAEKIGCSVRVDVCRDTTEMLQKLQEGVADVMVVNLIFPQKDKDSIQDSVVYKDAFDSLGWRVDPMKPLLEKELRAWYKPEMLGEVRKLEQEMLSVKNRVKRHVYAPMLDRAGGVISKWDQLFINNAPKAGWDWRLLAAQCYQESTFDPQARSWAGACGLMQIMPTTADHLGLPRDKMFDPESNVAAAAKLINELTGHFSDISDRRERINFVLAAYNGGAAHIRDAMALTEKYGGNKYRWTDVSRYVLLLMQEQYYRDPVVKHGYMRGSETSDYVTRIQQRYNEYRGVHSPLGGSYQTPRKAKKERKGKYRVG
jgi:membrane-bound lytic murein transglycosylase F